MKRLLLPLLLLLPFLASLTHAQSNPQTGHGAPTGVCVGPYTDTDTGNLYVCKTGQYTLAGGSSSSASSALTIDVASQVGAHFDTQSISLATLASGSAVVTAPAGTFAASDAGKNFVAFTTCGTGIIAATQGRAIAETTIVSFQSTSQVTVGANSNVTVAGTACIWWGHPDDAAFTAADTAAAAATACPTIQMPAKMGWIEQAHWITSLPLCENQGIGWQQGGIRNGNGLTVQGVSPGSSILFVAPNLATANSGTCIGSGGGTVGNTVCFGGRPSQIFRKFRLTGGGNMATGFPSLKGVFVLGMYADMDYVILDDFGSNDTNAIFQMGGPFQQIGGAINHSEIIGFGSELVTFGGGWFTDSALQSMCPSSGLPMLNIAATDTWISFHSLYAPSQCAAVNSRAINVNGILFSYGDALFSESPANSTFGFVPSSSGARVIVDGLSVGVGTGHLNVALHNPTANTYMRVSNSVLDVGAGNATITAQAAGAVVVDGGGNSLKSGILSVSGGGLVSGNKSQVENSTNTVVASRNTLLGTTTLLPASAPWTGTTMPFTLLLNAYDSAAGVGCTGNSTVTWTISYTDATGTAQTQTATETITTNGGATGGDKLTTTFTLLTQSGTAITYSATAPTGGSCATTVPSFAAQLALS